METIVVALIAGVLSLLGVIITSNKTTRDVQAKLDKRRAWFRYRMAYLHSERKSIYYAFYHRKRKFNGGKGGQPVAGRPLEIAMSKRIYQAAKGRRKQ